MLRTRALRGALLATAFGLVPASLGAQLFADASARVAPLVVQYRFGDPLDQTITEYAAPIFLSTGITRGLSVDLGTAWAQSTVDFPRPDGSRTTSSISGLTDTQLRGHYTFGNDLVVLTAGVNLPTGKTTATADQLPAASLIASDFLYFPISNFGTGLGWTGGAAVARPFGAWNVGLGASVRMSSEYAPFELEAGRELRYQPGNEYRARIGVDRPIGSGRVALGFTYSSFGSDEIPGSSIYKSGDRMIGQASWNMLTPIGDLGLAVWDLYRAPGERAGGTSAPWENIANVAVHLSSGVGGLRLEPSVQYRHWLQRVEGSGTTPGYSTPSVLVEAGLGTHFSVPGFSLHPSVAGTFGSVATTLGGHASLSGFRVQMTARLR